MRCGVPKVAHLRPREAGRGAFARSAKEAKITTEFTGLCSNCKSRETCAYPKPAGGVWFCEEYQ